MASIAMWNFYHQWESVAVIERNGDRIEAVHVLFINYAWGYVTGLAPSDLHFFCPLKTPRWQVMCNRREASRPILATDICHRFLLCWGIAHGGTVEEMLKHQWWIRASLMCIICYPYAVCISRSGQSSRIRVSVTLRSSACCVVSSAWLLINDELESVWKDVFLLWLRMYRILCGSRVKASKPSVKIAISAPRLESGILRIRTRRAADSETSSFQRVPFFRRCSVSSEKRVLDSPYLTAHISVAPTGTYFREIWYCERVRKSV